MFNKELEASERTLGMEHPDTLTLNNLASLYHIQGKPTKRSHYTSEQLKHKNARKRHPSTLTSMNNLALLYGSQANTTKQTTIHQST